MTVLFIYMFFVLTVSKYRLKKQLQQHEESIVIVLNSQRYIIRNKHNAISCISEPQQAVNQTKHNQVTNAYIIVQ